MLFVAEAAPPIFGGAFSFRVSSLELRPHPDWSSLEYLPAKKAGRSGGEALSGLVSKLLGGRRKSIRSRLHRRWTILPGRCGRRRLCRVAYSIGHQADIYAAVIGAARFRVVRLDRLVLAQPDHVNLMGGDVVLRCQVLNHGVRAALAQIVVVIGRSHGIGATFQRNNVALGAGDIAGQLIKRLFGGWRQIVFVETELYRRLRPR